MMNHTSGMEKQVRTLRKRSIFTLFLTWLALFFTVIGIAAGYKNFLRVHDKAKEATLDAKIAKDLLPELARKDSIQNWQEQVREQLKSSSEQRAKEVTELKNVSNTSAYVADTLNEQVRQLTLQQETLKSPQKQSDQWKAEEVRYLLRTALRKLQLDQDPAGAEKALVLADSVLIDLGSSAFLSVRQAIAKDIALLKETSAPDQTVLIRSIDQVASSLQALMTTVIVPAQDSQLLIEGEGRNSLLERVQASISEVVVIRQYDQALAKRISGDAQSVHLELLRLKLENLKQLGLNQRVEAYQLQLKQISDDIQQEQAGIFGDLKSQLESLQGLVRKPDLIELQSPVLLDDAIANTESAGVTQ